MLTPEGISREPKDLMGDLGVSSGVSYLPIGIVESGALEEESIELLVGSAREGNRIAFGRLYERYARMVHGILLARVPRAEIDDLVQDVFVQAMRHLHTLRDAGRFGAWLAAMTRNRANDFHRRSVEQVEWNEEVHPQGSPGEIGDDGAAILGAIRELPEAYRETLILRLVEGMTGPEIAERTGLTAGSVRVNLHRGMEMLRDKLRWDKT